ncbi:hypothetical protein JOM56_014916 [Amanita muscaria]
MDMPHVSRNTPTSLLPSGVMFAGSRQPNFGVHNPSPIKKRNKKKTNTYVTPPLQDVRRTALLNRLQELRSGIDAILCNGDPDRVLRSFKCPNLTDFKLEISDWTLETYKIIENQYNLHQLLRFNTSSYPYPISKLLFDAPMLQELILLHKVFLDERALQGVASGELGRCLTLLVFFGNFNEKKVLDMVASRQRHVKQAVEASRSWQDQQISGIRWISLSNYNMRKDNALVKDSELKGKIDELEELGVIVYDSFIEAMTFKLHPLSGPAFVVY